MSDESVERITRLAELMSARDLDALTLRVGETTYELVRRDPAPPAAPAFAAVAATASAPAEPASSPPAAARYKKVVAPINGIFYRAAAPGSAPFVEVGDRVEVGQTLCILEAMKNMNEIASDFAGVVRSILATNGDLVSRDEEIFWIEP